ncbi:MAG: glycosyltransferase family 2 protein [Bacteroidales bacterium]|nr:glycosyltransferase family 2 protein [Candidatus Colicola coprequi]
MNKHPHISIVSPEYRGEKMVKELVDRIATSVSTITENWEIILVNDASPDDTWSEIEKACAQDKRVKGLNLSRNFGQHYAITAGLNYAKGDWVVVMDCDLQDRPEEIPNLYKKAQEGYDSVLAQRVHREHSWIKQLGSKSFYALLAYLTETKQDASVANFGIYNRKVINAILAMGDKMRYFPAQVQWVGFRKAYLPIQHDARAEGKSTYNFGRLFKLALDTIISFSDKPMRLMVKIGAWMTILSFLIALIYIIRYFVGDIQVMGFTSLIISIWFLTGVVISLLGLVGLYIGKMFDTVKNRPTYIVSETKNCAE